MSGRIGHRQMLDRVLDHRMYLKKSVPDRDAHGGADWSAARAGRQ
jgi:hypothetical protein